MKRVCFETLGCAKNRVDSEITGRGETNMKARRIPNRRSISEPEIVYRKGRPTAVLLDIRDYETLLDRLEDLHDIEVLTKRLKDAPTYRDFDEYLAERDS
jgi:PHD/YefM family antitoxin component YafN of YafNO toxin-antitoxin module